MATEYYGYEITPVSRNEINLRALYHIDPQMDMVPTLLLNWGNRQFTSFMLSRLLKFGKTFAGSKYEEKVKDSKNKEFYDFLTSELEKYYGDKF